MGEYLTLLYREYDRNRRIHAFKELKKLLSKDDIERIEGESRKFRRQFKLRNRL